MSPTTTPVKQLRSYCCCQLKTLLFFYGSSRGIHQDIYSSDWLNIHTAQDRVQIWKTPTFYTYFSTSALHIQIFTRSQLEAAQYNSAVKHLGFFSFRFPPCLQKTFQWRCQDSQYERILWWWTDSEKHLHYAEKSTFLIFMYVFVYFIQVQYSDFKGSTVLIAV